MAKPRVFVSSTYYDQRHVRADLEIFIKEMGYEPVLSESGHVPYGKEDKPEEYCYKEIGNVDILVAIVGGRYGSPSASNPTHSISQIELKTAHELGKPIYIFIDRNVNNEYSTYLLNKDNSDVQYGSVDDLMVFKFMEEIKELPFNNPITSFETSADIIRYLR